MRGSHPQDGGLNPVPRAANLGKITVVPLPPCPPHVGIDTVSLNPSALIFSCRNAGYALFRFEGIPRRDALTKNDHSARVAVGDNRAPRQSVKTSAPMRPPKKPSNRPCRERVCFRDDLGVFLPRPLSILRREFNEHPHAMSL